MRLRFDFLACCTVLAFGLAGCGGGSEPSEAQMKAAMLDEMNHPPGYTVTQPVSITFFKRGACDKPTPQGFSCTFTVKVASTNIAAGMYMNIPMAVFYNESGKWMMRPPF